MSDSEWHQEETYKSLILYGNNALKFVLLINGGAVIEWWRRNSVINISRELIKK